MKRGIVRGRLEKQGECRKKGSQKGLIKKNPKIKCTIIELMLNDFNKINIRGKIIENIPIENCSLLKFKIFVLGINLYL